MVGIICPLVEIGLTVTQNLGKALALEALVAVAPLQLKIYPSFIFGHEYKFKLWPFLSSIFILFLEFRWLRSHMISYDEQKRP